MELGQSGSALVVAAGESEFGVQRSSPARNVGVAASEEAELATGSDVMETKMMEPAENATETGSRSTTPIPAVTGDAGSRSHSPVPIPVASAINTTMKEGVADSHILLKQGTDIYRDQGL